MEKDSHWEVNTNKELKSKYLIKLEIEGNRKFIIVPIEVFKCIWGKSTILDMHRNIYNGSNYMWAEEFISSFKVEILLIDDHPRYWFEKIQELVSLIETVYEEKKIPTKEIFEEPQENHINNKWESWMDILKKLAKIKFLKKRL